MPISLLPTTPSAGKASERKQPHSPKVAHRSAWRVWLWRLVLIVVLLVAWELAARSGLVDKIFTGQPSQIGKAFGHGISAGSYWHDLGVTAYETFVGFAISAVAGVLAGVVAAQIPMIDQVVRPLLTAANSVPRIALAPLFVLWFGLGSVSRIALVVSVTFFVVIFNTLAALASVERDVLLLARSLGAGKAAIFWRYRLPGAVPTIFAGLQLGLTYSILADITGEMLTGTDGLGAQLTYTISLYQTNEFFAVLLLLVIVAVGVSSLLQRLERRLLRWRVSEVRGLEG